jgi:hypothetical protein
MSETQTETSPFQFFTWGIFRPNTKDLLGLIHTSIQSTQEKAETHFVWDHAYTGNTWEKYHALGYRSRKIWMVLDAEGGES